MHRYTDDRGTSTRVGEIGSFLPRRNRMKVLYVASGRFKGVRLFCKGGVRKIGAPKRRLRLFWGGGVL